MKPNFAGVNTSIRQALKLEVEATRNTNFEKLFIPFIPILNAPHKLRVRVYFMSNSIGEIIAD